MSSYNVTRAKPPGTIGEIVQFNQRWRDEIRAADEKIAEQHQISTAVFAGEAAAVKSTPARITAKSKQKPAQKGTIPRAKWPEYPRPGT